MKKITFLTMLVSLLGVTAFAQQATTQGPSTTIKGIVRQSQTAIRKAPAATADKELVTLLTDYQGPVILTDSIAALEDGPVPQGPAPEGSGFQRCPHHP